MYLEICVNVLIDQEIYCDERFRKVVGSEG